MQVKVAIQGIEGSFHHQVAMEYFGDEVQTLNCSSFEEVASSVSSGKAGAGVMAIENSIAGSILPNYGLLSQYELQVTGEHYTEIDLQLMALPGQTLQQIKTVWSHPMALLQCKSFFRIHPHIRLLEETDTAGAARRIAAEGKESVAAVAGKAAAQKYGLDILVSGIHSTKNNFTRFLILRDQREQQNPAADKASLKFELASRPGSLAGVLNMLRDFELDMTKIQSLPVPGIPWKYTFFIDVLFSEAERLQQALEVIHLITENLEIFGTYKNNLK